MRRRVVLTVPGPIGQATGGYTYDRRIVAGLRDLGLDVAVHELAGTFPRVDATARTAARLLVDGLGPHDLPVIDGLALPAFEYTPPRARWLALVHHPLALETGLGPGQADAFRRLEAHLLAQAARVVVTSRRTARDVAALGVPPARIGVVEPGVDPRPLAPGDGSPPLLLAVGALVPRKGHEVLLRALAELRAREWRLVCAGDDRRDLGTAARLRRLRGDLGLRERVAFTGEVGDARLARLYGEADLLVLASRHEGFGMALTEALAYGLPVISTTAGAIPDTVPPQAGLLVTPDDTPALTTALHRWLTDPALRVRLRSGARQARIGLSDWRRAAQGFARELERATA